MRLPSHSKRPPRSYKLGVSLQPLESHCTLFMASFVPFFRTTFEETHNFTSSPEAHRFLHDYDYNYDYDHDHDHDYDYVES